MELEQESLGDIGRRDGFIDEVLGELGGLGVVFEAETSVKQIVIEDNIQGGGGRTCDAVEEKEGLLQVLRVSIILELVDENGEGEVVRL